MEFPCIFEKWLKANRLGWNMIDGLISGRLHGAPEERIDKNGAPFVVAKVLASSSEGENIINVTAFESATSKALLSLEEGDSVALAGSLTECGEEA
jgi:hypothetical protein